MIHLIPCHTDHSLKFSSTAQLNSVTPRTAACQASFQSPTPRTCSSSCPLSCWCHPSYPLSSPLLLPSNFPSIRVFSNESVLQIRWPKYWSFSFSISPHNEYSWLVSFRMDWFDFLAVQGTLKSLLQHHSSKASIFRAQFFLWSKFHIHTWRLHKA